MPPYVRRRSKIMATILQRTCPSLAPPAGLAVVDDFVSVGRRASASSLRSGFAAGLTGPCLASRTRCCRLDDGADDCGPAGPLCVLGFGSGCGQGRSECCEVGELAVDVAESGVEELDDGGAGLLACALEVDDAGDFVEAEPDGFGLADEPQDGEVFGPVGAVAGVGPQGRFEEAALLVEPDRLWADSGVGGGVADGDPRFVHCRPVPA